MRACEGCRRRKIRCDAATTNAWPCSACVRLKLHCIPPSANPECELEQGSVARESHHSQANGHQNGAGTESFQRPSMIPQHSSGPRSSSQEFVDSVSFAGDSTSYETSPYLTQIHGQIDPPPISYASTQDPSLSLQDLSYTSIPMFSEPPGQAVTAMATPDTWQSDPYSPDLLSDALGELRVDESGMGMTVAVPSLKFADQQLTQ